MAFASGVAIDLRKAALPVLDGVAETFAAGIASSLQPGNRRSVAQAFGSRAEGAPDILFDPQTAGGLLLGIPADHAAACLKELRDAGCRSAADIGAAVEMAGRATISLL